MSRNNSYKGFETLFNSARMSFKMYWYTFVFFAALHLCLFIIVAVLYLTDPLERFSFLKPTVLQKLSPL